MIGYCNLRTNDLPWTRHVGEIRRASQLLTGAGESAGLSPAKRSRSPGLQKLLARMASGKVAALKVFHSLGFRNQALLSGCVKNENGLTEDLVIMSRDVWRALGIITAAHSALCRGNLLGVRARK